jgi:phosphotriesterase-related protein
MHEHVVTRSPGVQENWPHLWDRNAILAIAERKMADLFIRDITQGIGTSGVKAAIIKCATDTAGVTPVIDNILRASARAQKATGVPISTHTWAAGRTGEMQQAIFAQEGVDLSGYLRGLMERGSTIGMDRFGLESFLSTTKRVEVLARLCAEGYAGKMVLSHDANCWTDMLSEDAKRRTRPLWHYNHIPDDILPALRKAGVSEDQIDQMLMRNPRVIFEARNDV